MKKIGQCNLTKDCITLHVRRGNFIITTLLFLVAVSLFIGPLVGVTYSIANGAILSIGYAVPFVLFWIGGFYLLRLALWNSYGKEVLTVTDNGLNYEADYGLFKDSRKELIGQVSYSFKPIGGSDSKIGRLVVHCEEGTQINCTTKMPIEELKEVIKNLEAQAA